MKTKEELRRIMPDRVRALGLDPIGNPLLFFCERGANGLVNYRAVRAEAVDRCLTHRLCYICGTTLGRNQSFLTGPVGALRQVAIDPPCHRACAVYAAQACPYFTKPKLRPDAMPLHNAGAAGEVPRPPDRRRCARRSRGRTRRYPIRLGLAGIRSW